MSVWHETETTYGAPRWTRNMWPHRPFKPHVWLCVGNDGGREGRVAVWGGSRLGGIEWQFGSSCTHEKGRGLELGGVVAGVIESEPRVSGFLGEWETFRWSNGQGAAESRHGDLHLMVNSSRSLVTRGRHVSGIYEGYEPKENQEVVNLWRWWLHLERPDGGKPWIMKSWAGFREQETARAHAEQIAQALTGVGFGLREVLEK